jgi:hypothetical protein
MLFLELGTRSGKLCGLDAQKISDGERRKIVNGLTGVSLEAAIRWLRANCPIAFKNAYRELTLERVGIRSRHKIDPSRIM